MSKNVCLPELPVWRRVLRSGHKVVLVLVAWGNPVLLCLQLVQDPFLPRLLLCTGLPVARLAGCVIGVVVIVVAVALPWWRRTEGGGACDSHVMRVNR